MGMRIIAASSYTHVALAFLLMGSWALFANRMHPMPEQLLAALI
jgi:hypothetical protein